MVPLEKNQSLKEYGEVAAHELIERVEKALALKGREAAWDEIFNAICCEGQHVREVSPAAIMIYQFYIVAAVTFLAQFPDPKKVLDLANRVKEDIGRYTGRLSKMRSEIYFTSDECVSTVAAMAMIGKMMRSLVR